MNERSLSVRRGDIAVVTVPEYGSMMIPVRGHYIPMSSQTSVDDSSVVMYDTLALPSVSLFRKLVTLNMVASPIVLTNLT